MANLPQPMWQGRRRRRRRRTCCELNSMRGDAVAAVAGSKLTDNLGQLACVCAPIGHLILPLSLSLFLSPSLSLFALPVFGETKQRATKLIKRRFNIIQFQFITFCALPLPASLPLPPFLPLLLLYYFYSTCAIFIVARSK